MQRQYIKYSFKEAGEASHYDLRPYFTPKSARRGMLVESRLCKVSPIKDSGPEGCLLFSR
jgi:hypothetical protein